MSNMSKMELLESSESLGAWNYTQDAIKLLEKRLTDFNSSRERTKQQKETTTDKVWRKIAP